MKMQNKDYVGQCCYWEVLDPQICKLMGKSNNIGEIYKRIPTALTAAKDENLFPPSHISQECRQS